MWRQSALPVICGTGQLRGARVTVATIDTLEVVKELRAAGFTDDQAEAVTRVVRRAQEVDLSNLATKPDITAVKTDVTGVKTDLAALKDVVALKTDVVGVKTDVAALKDSVALKTDLTILRADLEKSLAETKAEILKWMVSTIGLQTVVIIGAVIGLVKLLH